MIYTKLHTAKKDLLGQREFYITPCIKLKLAKFFGNSLYLRWGFWTIKVIFMNKAFKKITKRIYNKKMAQLSLHRYFIGRFYDLS